MSTIANLGALRRRKSELALQAARYGISVDPHITIELRDLEQVIGLMERIDIHRGNLTHMLTQRGHFGANVPTHIVTQIATEREQIATLRLQCARLGYPVDSHEVDADAIAIEAAPPTPDPRPAETQLDRIERKLNELLRRIPQ
jgi:hypothetical protein